MIEKEYFLEQDFIIFNSSLGLRDFVSINRIEENSKNIVAYLDVPYEMVYFNLDELLKNGKILFEQCIVFTEKFWHENQSQIQRDSYFKQEEFNRQYQEQINNHNKRKNYLNEQQYRELLCLPLEGKLKKSQIKNAFKTLAKKTHPDVGGSHDKFISISNAQELLLKNLDLQ